MCELLEVAKALRDYIDAIPKEIEFKVAMPGMDRDWVDNVIEKAERGETCEILRIS